MVDLLRQYSTQLLEMGIQVLAFVDSHDVALGRVENLAPVSSPLFQMPEILL